ncbi:hypothetical protein [Halopenitus persicus]|uniref:hypothetical protein n=1 Tax=Halopenitus persicus TaxID=1048396 RepID=UPI000BBB2B2A|nr:hypothetical protein [Halopenitus persicus]
MDEPKEACGRCGMTAVVEMSEDGPGSVDEEYIEVDDGSARAVSPGAWLGRLTDRLDGVAMRLTYGRR